MLQDPAFDRRNLEVVNPAKFIIRRSIKQFDGSLSLKYSPKSEEERKAAKAYGFACSKQTCSMPLYDLKGTIHQKNDKQDYSQILTFYHPFKLGFYEYKTSGLSQGVGKALLPFTITLDIVTSPLQLIAFSIIVSNY
ncbi:hypothetical protein M8320_04095 [Leclercia sp. H6W5]|uniref:hypothetical protein n=1 Tax=Leclercia tamurae TaxID=2926467 RepID=UPI0021D3290F|nr:hypothetical protein [Leclercia tamurae]MCU6681194.1 hypothetical protein [Leclercia tamurae]